MAVSVAAAAAVEAVGVRDAVMRPDAFPPVAPTAKAEEEEEDDDDDKADSDSDLGRRSPWLDPATLSAPIAA